MKRGIRKAGVPHRHGVRTRFFAPHLLYPSVLNDAVPEERQAELDMGLAILLRCDGLWVFGPHISSEMQAERMRIPIWRMEIEKRPSAERDPEPDTRTAYNTMQILPL